MRKTYRVDFFLEFDNDGERLAFTDIVRAKTPEEAAEDRKKLYTEHDVEFTLVDVTEI